MKINRLKQMLVYSFSNKEKMESLINGFYASVEMDNKGGTWKLMQIVRPLLERNGYMLVEFPFSDRKITSIYYKGSSIGYIFLNTSLPKTQVNFALCREIYHALYQKTEAKGRVWLLKEHYFEYEEEFAANLFAEMLMMPEETFKIMYRKFRNEVNGEEHNLSVLVKLMYYFEVPYMAALIRCYELNLLDSGEVLEELLKVDEENIRMEWKRLWLDESILNPTWKNDYDNLETLVRMVGSEYQNDYADERTVTKVLQNMRRLYEKIKGE